MAHAKWDLTSSVEAGRGPRLATKIAVALAVCLSVRILWGQAASPPASTALVPEEVDAQGYKYQVPLAAYVDKKNVSKLNKMKNDILALIKSQPSGINEPATRATL